MSRSGLTVPRDDSRALTRAQVTTVLGLEVALRERVLRQMLYETAARAEEVLMLGVPHLDTANRRAVVTRKGGAKDVVVWQTGTARLLPRMLVGRRRRCTSCGTARSPTPPRTARPPRC